VSGASRPPGGDAGPGEPRAHPPRRDHPMPRPRGGPFAPSRRCVALAAVAVAVAVAAAGRGTRSRSRSRSWSGSGTGTGKTVSPARKTVDPPHGSRRGHPVRAPGYNLPAIHRPSPAGDRHAHP
jgi:hypothetical protein